MRAIKTDLKQQGQISLNEYLSVCKEKGIITH